MQVFISHSSADRDFTVSLATALRQQGVSVWFDSWEIKVGDSIVARINEGIGASDALIVVLSPASVASRWVSEELNAATMRMLSDSNILLLPVLHRGCEVPPLLRHRKYADFTGEFAVGFFELLEAIVPLHRLWVELAAIERAHAEIIGQIRVASAEEDVTVKVRALHDLMVQALDTRCEVELRHEFTAKPKRPANFFDKIEVLAERGIDVRSRTWNKLVYMRSGMAHEFRSAYTSAIGFAEFFAEDPSSRQDMRENFDRVLNRLREIMATITRLTDGES